MKLVIIFLTLAINTFSNTVYRYKRAPIINGSPAKIQRFPYYASIVRWNSSEIAWQTTCGASILSEYWLLSAAHCLRHRSIRTRRIRTGWDKYFSSNDTQVELYQISIIHKYPQFIRTNESVLYDIALIKTSLPIQLIKKRQWPIFLPNQNFSLKTGKQISIVGLGSSSVGDNGITSQLKYGKVQVISQEFCRRMYGDRISDPVFCTRPVHNYDCGKSDSGGPAVINFQLVGIISRGSCRRDSRFSIFTAVQNYTDWIMNKTGISTLAPVGYFNCIKSFCIY